MIDNLIAYHCGPALAGIKSANIVSCSKDRFPNVRFEVRRLNRELNPKDIYVEMLCECENRALIMVYRAKQLLNRLNEDDISSFLKSVGYPSQVSLEGYIDFLKLRLKEKDFPHEIGAFLGYPMHDIYGFINNRKDECLMTGEWKVYKNEAEARAVFNRYSKCRAAIMRRISSGKTLAQIFCAA